MIDTRRLGSRFLHRFEFPREELGRLGDRTVVGVRKLPANMALLAKWVEERRHDAGVGIEPVDGNDQRIVVLFVRGGVETQAVAIFLAHCTPGIQHREADLPRSGFYSLFIMTQTAPIDLDFERGFVGTWFVHDAGGCVSADRAVQQCQASRNFRMVQVDVTVGQ